MHFCDKCGNMLYLKITKEGEETLINYCRKCGNIEKNIINESNDTICVSKTHIKKTQQTYKNIINEYTKLDPTLPRIKNINCPNNDCKSNATVGETKDENEIIYLRYDNENMRYIYLCTSCNHSWKNN
uniref:DNA-directed RNA polymerase II subunit RPB9-like zinc ribbon domain-containing protein n=1 Tax=viral metagenome TaxID=1070528 RepID=A0A6C0F6N1_9ZZZZ